MTKFGPDGNFIRNCVAHVHRADDYDTKLFKVAKLSAARKKSLLQKNVVAH